MWPNLVDGRRVRRARARVQFASFLRSLCDNNIFWNVNSEPDTPVRSASKWTQKRKKKSLTHFEILSNYNAIYCDFESRKKWRETRRAKKMEDDEFRGRLFVSVPVWVVFRSVTWHMNVWNVIGQKTKCVKHSVDDYGDHGGGGESERRYKQQQTKSCEKKGKPFESVLWASIMPSLSFAPKLQWKTKEFIRSIPSERSCGSSHIVAHRHTDTES